jgi:hypothetical protein
MPSHMLILGDREALAWVLANERMAFPGYRAREASRLRKGDELLLYTTRGCFRNPGRDRGRLIGTATAATAVERFDRPVQVAGREFAIGCELSLESLAPFRDGTELAPLISRLSSFPNKVAWPAQLRRPLLTLTAEDASLLRREIGNLAGPVVDGLAGYLAAGRPVGA